jgi:hypothetical protein
VERYAHAVLRYARAVELVEQLREEWASSRHNCKCAMRVTI